METTNLGLAVLPPHELTWDRGLRLFDLRCRSQNLSPSTQKLYQGSVEKVTMGFLDLDLQTRVTAAYRREGLQAEATLALPVVSSHRHGNVASARHEEPAYFETSLELMEKRLTIKLEGPIKETLKEILGEAFTAGDMREVLETAEKLAAALS